jgi:Mycobacterium membrane protein
LARVWRPLVAVVALSLGAVLMWKVHEFSAPPPVTTVLGPQAVPEFSPKEVRYEVFGSIGNGGMLVWSDVDGCPHRVNLTVQAGGRPAGITVGHCPDEVEESTTLPWSRTETTTLTVVSASISAQVHGGDHVGCRILVNGVVRAEQSETRQDAHVFCLVKSA